MGKGTGVCQTRTQLNLEGFTKSQKKACQSAFGYYEDNFDANTLDLIKYLLEIKSDAQYQNISDLKNFDMQEHLDSVKSLLDELPVWLGYVMIRSIRNNSQHLIDKWDVNQDGADFKPGYCTYVNHVLIQHINFLRHRSGLNYQSDAIKGANRSLESAFDEDYLGAVTNLISVWALAGACSNGQKASAGQQDFVPVKNIFENLMADRWNAGRRDRLLLQDRIIIQGLFALPGMMGANSTNWPGIDVSTLQSTIFERLGSYPSHPRLVAEFEKLYKQGLVVKNKKKVLRNKVDTPKINRPKKLDKSAHRIRTFYLPAQGSDAYFTSMALQNIDSFNGQNLYVDNLKSRLLKI